ncbi:MAG TPA: pitrilysin family protein [Gemmatimonadaceae bacterium]|nr:pitrilysin family protein [Gemmatimonadaceae bacterium]
MRRLAQPSRLTAVAAVALPLLSLARPAALAAQQPSPSGAAAPSQNPGRIAAESYNLANGLKVILAENHTAQVVAVDVWYDVGSRNERPTRTGFAHLFEHMMFQGSEHVKKGEHFQLIERAGGSLNGSTQDDRTNYFETLPSNRLNLGLWLEADRMRSLAVTQPNLDNQREAVKEERRLRVDNQPYARTFIDGLPQAFDSATCFAYAHSSIGSMDDLNAAKLEDVQAFFRSYYAPNNATLVITGDFQPAEAKRLVEQYFGGIPRVPDPPPVACTQSFNRGQKRIRTVDNKATLPAVAATYLIPEYKSDDTPPLELLATILGRGESSRLNVRLGRETKATVATQAIAGLDPRRGPNFFVVFGIANQGVPADSVDRLLAAEVARVAADGVTDTELTKAKNAYRAGAIEDRQRALNVAEALHTADTFLGSYEAVNSALDRYMKVTAADLKRVATTYLRPENSLVITIVPEGSK